MQGYFKNLRDNALYQHFSRVDNLGPKNDLKSMRKHINKHVPRGKVVYKMYELSM